MRILLNAEPYLELFTLMLKVFLLNLTFLSFNRSFNLNDLALSFSVLDKKFKELEKN